LRKYGLESNIHCFPDADTNTTGCGMGRSTLYSWGGSLYNSRVFTGRSLWGFSSCGKPLRLDLTLGQPTGILSPNTGTPFGLQSGNDHISPLDTNGKLHLFELLIAQPARCTRFIQEEDSQHS